MRIIILVNSVQYFVTTAIITLENRPRLVVSLKGRKLIDQKYKIYGVLLSAWADAWLKGK